MTVGTDHVEARPMGCREPVPVDHPAPKDLLQAVGRRPPVSRAAVGLAPEVVGMVVEMQPIPRRTRVSQALRR